MGRGTSTSSSSSSNDKANSDVVVSQPTSANNSAFTAVDWNLSYLREIDGVIIKQSLELLEILTGFETSNKYVIHNTLGQPIYYAAEDSCCLCRHCCGKMRKFTMHIKDGVGKEVITINRPYKCCSCYCCACCGPCRQSMEVFSNETLLGKVHQTCSCIKERFVILDKDGEKQLYIIGPCCYCDMCCCDISFKVYDYHTDDQVGNIQKKFSGVLQELFTDADTFGVSFPRDLDVNLKACLLAATFLIDYMVFEKQGSRDSPELIDQVP